jgi:hypothetical protein
MSLTRLASPPQRLSRSLAKLVLRVLLLGFCLAGLKLSLPYSKSLVALAVQEPQLMNRMV